jgi:hypothetical protein
MPKDKTPAEIKEIRSHRERRRLWTGMGFFALFWALFITGLAADLEWLLWLGRIAVIGEVIALYGLHEKGAPQDSGKTSPRLPEDPQAAEENPPAQEGE